MSCPTHVQELTGDWRDRPATRGSQPRCEPSHFKTAFLARQQHKIRLADERYFNGICHETCSYFTSFSWMGLLSILASIGAGFLLRMSFSGQPGNVCIQRVKRAARISCGDFRVCWTMRGIRSRSSLDGAECIVCHRRCCDSSLMVLQSEEDRYNQR